jgi:hypothetical protein
MRKTLTAVLAVLFVVGTVLAPAATAQGNQSSPGKKQQGIRDANGDGICDITGQPMGTGSANSQGAKNGKSWGVGDGTGNMGTRPLDGTGYGAQSGQRSGPRDGSGAGQQGPRSSQSRGGRRG